MRKNLLIFLGIICFTNLVNAQNVVIPDANFKNALLTGPNSGIDTNNDGEIQISEAQAYTDPIDVSNKNISDLTGIEAFTNIAILACSGNNLTALNLSQNTKLERLFCMYNQIQNLYLQNNSSLYLLYCYNNNLKRLNIANGNNSNMTIFNAINNPNLRCIQIDSGFTPPSSWSKDTTASYNRRCLYTIDAADPEKTVFDPVMGGLKLSNEITVYPNPTTDIVKVKNINDNFSKIEVYDLAGNKTLETTSESMNLSTLPKGIYTLKVIYAHDRVQYKRIIKR